jgi:hypothetical protein
VLESLMANLVLIIWWVVTDIYMVACTYFSQLLNLFLFNFASNWVMSVKLTHLHIISAKIFLFIWSVIIDSFYYVLWIERLMSE